MGRELGTRLLAAIPTMLAAAIFVFFVFRLLPGDYVDAMLGAAEGMPDPAVARELRAQYGLDRPVSEQFFSWSTNLIRGDLGVSLKSGKPVAAELLAAFPVTFELAIGAFVLSILIAIPLGVISAVSRNSWLDVGVRFTSLMGSAMPSFWLALLAIYVLAVGLRVLPATGYVAPSANPLENLKFAILPIVTLGLPLAGTLVRQVRGQLLEVLTLDYVRTARAKGLHERAVLYVHALRNSLIPVVTILGLRLGGLLGGALIAEQIFRWPGVGLRMLEAVLFRDYPMVQGCVLLFAFAYVMSNLLVDVVYTYLDPRLRRAG